VRHERFFFGGLSVSSAAKPRCRRVFSREVRSTSREHRNVQGLFKKVADLRDF
jgi:hypothetical protein